MQLHRLTLRAIGPFAGEHAVDLDRLGASGLFLLEGPTGAGKSTIIDAVVFALYGRVAGADASEDRMHSDFAAPEVEPFVELDFSTSSGIYRIRRTPRYDRPKRRGTGTTTQNATARLWRMASPDASPDGEPLANRIEEVGSEVSRVVGLTRDQFVQTVVLPQGEFAAFLRADAETRRALLQRLFGTEVYDRVVRQMEERRKAAHLRLRDADSQVTGAVRAFGGAAGVTADDELALSQLLDADDQLSRALDERVSGLAAASAAAAAKLAEADQAATMVTQRLAEARTHEACRVRKVELMAETARLERDEPGHRVRLARLEDATRAARVGPLLAGTERAARRRDGAQTRLVWAQDQLPADVASLPETGWKGEERRLRDLVGSLRAVVAIEQSLPGDGDAGRELQSRHAALGRRQSEVDAELAVLPTRIEELTRLARAAAQRSGAAAGAEQALSRAAERLDAALACAGLEGKVAQARTEREAAHRAALAAQSEEERLRRAYLDGVAGYLAVGLVAGTSCPVCGSTSHPKPAVRGPSAVDREDVERAATVRDRSQRDLEEAADSLAGLSERLAASVAGSGGLGVDQAEADLARAESAVLEAGLAHQEELRLRRDEDAARAALDQLREESADLGRQIATAAAAVARSAEEIAAKQQAVEGAAADFASVGERLAAMASLADAVAAAHSCAGELTDAERDLEARQQELATLVAAECFASPREAADAHLSAEAMSELRGQVRDFDDRRTSALALLAAPDLETVDAADVRDLPPLVGEAAERRSDLEAAQARWAGLAQREADSRARLADAVAVLTRRRDVAATTAAVIRMADLVAASSADNARAMTLPTFVLLERFGDVIAAANDRLSVMSDGRYSLEHVADCQGGRRSGLGLLVRDTHTDQPRDPRTLSGGETFYCSLALALGLADVVTAEAGGIGLGTLFVDEGFGSLDADTLEQVLSVLSGLGSGGRVVGIVSHVPELTERISERIAVRRLANGSSGLLVHA